MKKLIISFILLFSFTVAVVVHANSMIISYDNNDENLAREFLQENFARISNRLADMEEEGRYIGDLTIGEAYPMVNLRYDIREVYTEADSFIDIISPSTDWLFIIRNNGNSEFYVIVGDEGYNNFYIATYGWNAREFDRALNGLSRSANRSINHDNVMIFESSFMNFSFLTADYEILVDIPRSSMERARSSVVMKTEIVADIILADVAERVATLIPAIDPSSPEFDFETFINTVEFGGSPPRLSELYLQRISQ